MGDDHIVEIHKGGGKQRLARKASCTNNRRTALSFEERQAKEALVG